MATPGQMPVTFCTWAASASFSRRLLAAPGQGNTLKRVPELPYPHEGVSTLNCCMAPMTPSIVTPRSCKRFSISELTYSPLPDYCWFLCRDRFVASTNFPQTDAGSASPPGHKRGKLSKLPLLATSCGRGH